MGNSAYLAVIGQMVVSHLKQLLPMTFRSVINDKKIAQKSPLLSSKNCMHNISGHITRYYKMYYYIFYDFYDNKI